MSTLYDLNINKPAKINSLNSSNVFCNRLSEMGVLPGSLVRVVKKNRSKISVVAVRGSLA